VTVLTSFTVLAGIEWRALARVNLILNIILTFSSVSAVGMSVAHALCNISILQYYSVSIAIQESLANAKANARQQCVHANP